MQKIYVMGNLLVEQDSLPIKLMPELKKRLPDIEIKELDPSEDIKPERRELIIIDTVINTKSPCLITDIEKIELSNICSLHDFDLGYNLKLMKKFGMIDKVSIIGLPPDPDFRDIDKIVGLVLGLKTKN